MNTMHIPGFTAEASLFQASNYALRASEHARDRMLTESARSLVRLASSPGALSSVQSAIRYACHQVCMGDTFCLVVCGPIETI